MQRFQVRRLFVGFVVAGVLALGLVGPAAKDAYAKGNKNLRVEGVAVSIDVNAGTVLVTTSQNGLVGVATGAQTKIERNGVKVTLAAFRIGDRVQARFQTGNAVAVKIEAVGP